jgi:hypothetical protein
LYHFVFLLFCLPLRRLGLDLCYGYKYNIWMRHQKRLSSGFASSLAFRPFRLWRVSNAELTADGAGTGAAAAKEAAEGAADGLAATAGVAAAGRTRAAVDFDEDALARYFPTPPPLVPPVVGLPPGLENHWPVSFDIASEITWVSEQRKVQTERKAENIQER